MMDVGSHQYPIIRSHTEQGDETDPDCHAQIDRVHLEKIPHILSGDGEVHEPILSVKHSKIKPPAKATNTPEKWISEAVTVLN